MTIEELSLSFSILLSGLCDTVAVFLTHSNNRCFSKGSYVGSSNLGDHNLIVVGVVRDSNKDFH